MVLQKLYARRASGRGFTLIELAIVLAVAALLFAGLWRLLSAGNNQLRDQAVADQHKQLQSAVQAYLASPQGQAFVTAQGANANVDLPLPPAPGPCGLPAVVDQFCNFLPAGFTDATTNAYGQTYLVRVQKDAQAAGTAAQRYAFMILTNGGAVIPDTSGGRIASLIGNDGGFLYGTNVCGAAFATTACGAFGSWTTSTTLAAPNGFGFAGSASGHIASRTAVSVGALAADPWLARRGPLGAPLAGIATQTDFNTLQTDTFLMNPPAGGGTNDLFLGNNTIFGGSDRGTRAGAINMLHFMTVGLPFDPTGGVNGTPDTRATLTVRSPCRYVDQTNPTACTPAIQVLGDVTVSELLVANRLYAGAFIYGVVSDVRLKDDIQPIKNALDDLSKINAVSFRMKENGEEKLGVVAQEVEKVYPQLVNNIGGDYKGVDYIGLIGPLIGAVNELRKQNEVLRAEVKDQATAIKRLQKAAH